MIPLIKPIGIGDLKVVKQKLARYEAGEVAHVENIMKKEKRSRKHRHFHQLQEILTVEEERIEESMRDLQSTERFEMQNESQRTIRSQTTIQAGVDISASYGPVSITAYGRFDSTSSVEESDTSSTKYAKEVTEKTLARLVEKVRRERTTRTTEEYEEQNLHGFDNTEGREHIAGIYRWVDKYYRAKIVNYGKRLMYEFVVPEPASFYVFATKYNLITQVLPEKPEPPTRPNTSIPLSPSDVTRYTYLNLVKLYDVQDVQPPPQEWIRVSKAFHKELQTSGNFAFSSDDLKIPKGYKAKIGRHEILYTYVVGQNPQARTLVGQVWIDIHATTTHDITLIDEQGIIPVSGIGLNLLSFVISLGIWCELVKESYEKWQLDTYIAIMNSYRKALLDYEEKVAAAQISQGVAIGGANPEINREIEKRELKRSSLTMWIRSQFDYPPGINHTPADPIPGNYPEINIDNAIANEPAIEFFEKAFDWNNITYEFVPYYWGRKPKWLDNLSYKDNDPIFESFLQAGAARVVVPVNPSYTGAVLYYQLTGLIWPGGEVPPFDETTYPDAQLYNSYISEMADVEDLPDIDRDVEIDPSDESTWLMKVPTTLVWLQSDNELPNFEV
jgi:hypothetical protein